MNYLSKYKNKDFSASESVSKNSLKHTILVNFCFVVMSICLAIVSVAIIKNLAKSEHLTYAPTVNYDVFENGGKDA